MVQQWSAFLWVFSVLMCCTALSINGTTNSTSTTSPGTISSSTTLDLTSTSGTSSSSSSSSFGIGRLILQGLGASSSTRTATSSVLSSSTSSSLSAPSSSSVSSQPKSSVTFAHTSSVTTSLPSTSSSPTHDRRSSSTSSAANISPSAPSSSNATSSSSSFLTSQPSSSSSTTITTSISKEHFVDLKASNSSATKRTSFIPGTGSINTDTNATLATSVLSCNSASVSWALANSNSTITTQITSVVTSTSNSTTWITPDGPVFTLCDHYPRVNATPTFSVINSTYVATTVVLKTITPTCTANCPSCTIGSNDCSSLWSSYNFPGTSAPSITSVPPACPSPSSSACDKAYKPFSNCIFQAGQVRLVYFPPKIQGNRLCGNYTTVPPPANLTAPVTAEALGTTFTSGTAYISFQSLRAVDTCYSQIGTVMSDFYIPLPSSSVSSMCGDNNGVFVTGPGPTAMNFADLEAPIATNVYACQPRCHWGAPVVWQALCPTIYDDYAPALAYPTAQVRQLQQGWGDCGFEGNTYFRYQYGEEYYLFDPPKALTEGTLASGEGGPSLVTKPPGALFSTTIVNTPSLSFITPFPSSTPVVATPSPTPHTETVVTFFGETAPSSGADPTNGGSSNTAPSSNNGLTSSNEGSLNNAGSTNDNGDSSGTEGPSSNGVTSNDQGSGNIQGSGDGNGASQGGGALGVLESALSTPEGVQPAANVPPTTASNQGVAIVIGNSLTVPLSQGQQSSLQLPGGSAITATRDGSDIVVAGHTLAPGQVATIQGEQISAMPLQQNGGNANSPMLPAETLGVSRVGSFFVVNGATLTPGQATTINGQAVSLNSQGGITIGSITLAPGAATNVAIPTDVGASLQASRSGSVYFVNGAALTPGQAITAGGQTISAGLNGQGLFVGTSQLSLNQGVATVITPGPPTPLTISRTGSNFVVGGTTMTPGAVATIDGQRVSALPSGNGVVVGSSTFSLAPNGATTLSPADLASNTNAFTMSRSVSNIIVDGSIMTVGQVATIDGQVVSILPNGQGVRIGSSTISLPNSLATTVFPSSSLVAEGLVTIGSKTLTAYAVPENSIAVVIGDTTLSVGGSAATINGEKLSLGSSGLVEVDASLTSTMALTGSGGLAASTPATTVGVASTPSSTKKSAAFRTVYERFRILLSVIVALLAM